MEVYCVIDETIKLSDKTHKKWLDTPLAGGNAQAHAFRLTVLNDSGSAADLSGIGVTGEFLRQDNETVSPITGTKSGNVLEIILPPSCYAAPGRFTFTMDVTNGGKTRTALWVNGAVERKNSTSIVDPGTPVTNYETIIANANAAAERANAAADSIPESIDIATLAETKTYLGIE